MISYNPPKTCPATVTTFAFAEMPLQKIKKPADPDFQFTWMGIPREERKHTHLADLSLCNPRQRGYLHKTLRDAKSSSKSLKSLRSA